jgi:hypothetical protein
MDTRDTRFQNLLFLLSAAPIGLGCVIAGDDAETGVATENPTTENPTAGTTETAETDTPMTTGMTGSTGPVADTGSTGPGADTSTGPGAETTTGGVEVPPACATYADLVTMCYDAEAGAGAASYCADAFANYEANYGAECVAAFEDWLACLSALTCEEFTGAEPVCADQSGALETACAAK